MTSDSLGAMGVSTRPRAGLTINSASQRFLPRCLDLGLSPAPLSPQPSSGELLVNRAVLGAELDSLTSDLIISGVLHESVNSPTYGVINS